MILLTHGLAAGSVSERVSGSKKAMICAFPPAHGPKHRMEVTGASRATHLALEESGWKQHGKRNRTRQLLCDCSSATSFQAIVS
jgi:hypothetical protein